MPPKGDDGGPGGAVRESSGAGQHLPRPKRHAEMCGELRPPRKTLVQIAFEPHGDREPSGLGRRRRVVESEVALDDRRETLEERLFGAKRKRARGAGVVALAHEGVELGRSRNHARHLRRARRRNPRLKVHPDARNNSRLAATATATPNV